MRLRQILVAFLATSFGLCSALAAEPPAVLHLADTGFVPGVLRASGDPKVLRWQSPAFARPLEFPLSAVQSVHYASAAPRPQARGAYCFELAGDDVIYGDLVGLTDEAVELEAERVGRIRLNRGQVRRFYRWQEADSIYHGPNGLAEWKDAAPTSNWRDEGGHLFSDRPGASLFADIGIPDKAVIELELSWRRKPDFSLALGVNEKEDPKPYAFHFEVWDNDLVVVGESARSADVTSLQEVGDSEGHLRVQVYLDQKERRLIVLSRGGKPLTVLHLYGKPAAVRPGVRLVNKKGDVRLEHLRVTRWNGVPPRDVREDQARVHRTDGTILYGQLASYDPKTKQFTVRDGKSETRLADAAIADVFLAPAGAKPPSTAAEPILRLAYRDGTRLSGPVTQIEDDHVSIRRPGIDKPVRLPLADIRSLVSVGVDETPAATPVEGRAGRLEMDGLRLKGRLVDGTELKDASCLTWRPDLGLNASPLALGTSGKVIYREVAPPRPAGAQRVQQQLGGPARVAEIQRFFQRSNRPVKPAASSGRLLHLRSGDTIPCEVTRIDEKGVTLKTTISEAQFVANENIKSVELIPNAEGPKLVKSKRERLLTVPRVRRDTPPTHLVCSKNGDFLRGRVLEMDDRKLKVEVRLDTSEIPRDRVAQLIWLHPDEMTAAKPTAKAPPPAGATRVQSLRGTDRLTFRAEKVAGGTLSGQSDVLGACRAVLDEVDQVLFGTMIEQSAAQLAYHRWKLMAAIEPKFVQAAGDDSGGERPSGIDSVLVGQPAFSFRLDMLQGKRFNLADRKGKIVVLDFWATWCGPCLQAMPLVEGVVREFADKGVELVAVNMEEQPETIKAMMERHKLKMPVVLDRDGVVAAKYNVTAIPQTVLIDREGKVARLFVGGGQKTIDALKKAIQELVAGKPGAGS